MCFLVHHCPSFFSCLQNTIYFIHFYSQSRLIGLGEGEGSKKMSSCLSSFYGKQNICLILSSVPSRRWNKEGSEKRKVDDVVFSNPSIHPSHSTCVECLPLFSCSPRYRIHLFPAHYLPREKNTNSLCVKLKAPGKGKSQLC